MIKRIKGVSTLKQREYIKAENKSYDTLVENGFIPNGRNHIDNFKTVSIFRKISAYENKFIGDYKNFQHAKEALVDLV